MVTPKWRKGRYRRVENQASLANEIDIVEINFIYLSMPNG